MLRRALVIAFLCAAPGGLTACGGDDDGSLSGSDFASEPRDPAKNVPADQIGKVNVIPAGSDWYVGENNFVFGLTNIKDEPQGGARAIATAGRPGAAPLLWYKTLVGDAEVAPLYACFGGLLALEPERAPAHVGRYLRAANPALAEAAALALGESRLPDAAPVLREAWAAADDPALRATCLDALARLGDEAAFDFLLDLLANGPAHDAHNARRALLSATGDDARRRRKVERAAARRDDLD